MLFQNWENLLTTTVINSYLQWHLMMIFFCCWQIFSNFRLFVRNGRVFYYYDFLIIIMMIIITLSPKTQYIQGNGLNPYYPVVLHTMIMIKDYVESMLNSRMILSVDMMIHLAMYYIGDRIARNRTEKKQKQKQKINQNWKCLFKLGQQRKWIIFPSFNNSIHKHKHKHKTENAKVK